MPWAPDYVTTAELAAEARITDALDDSQLARAVAGGSRAVDNSAKRQFGQVAAPEARYYRAAWSVSTGRWVVPVDDLMTAAGLVVSLDLAGDGTYSTAVTAADYVLRPRNSAAEGRPWTELLFLRQAAARPTGAEGEVKAVGQWGWTAVPTVVKEASLLQAMRFLARREAPFGIAGSPEVGSEMRLLAKVDPDVAVMLREYRRKVWAR